MGGIIAGILRLHRLLSLDVLILMPGVLLSISPCRLPVVRDERLNPPHFHPPPLVFSSGFRPPYLMNSYATLSGKYY